MKISAEIRNYVSIKKRRRRSAQNIAKRAVHDRTASDLVRGSMVEPVEIDDPYEKGEKIIALRSYRDDPLARLKRGSHIDEAQYAAGLAWQRDFEAAQGMSAVRAMQYKDPVDGSGQIPDPITDRQREAIKRLAECDRELGQLGSQIIRLFLGTSMGAASIASHFGRAGKAEMDYFGRRIRECLETLCAVYKLKTV